MSCSLRSLSPWATRPDAARDALQTSAHENNTKAILSPLDPEEDESGNVEYKLQILPPSVERFDRLVTQLSWRLMEGGGTCVYELGIRDDGALVGITQDDMRQTLSYLCAMADNVGATISLQRLVTKRSTDTGDSAGYDTLHVVTDRAEADDLLSLSHGLPEAEVIGVTPSASALTIELATPPSTAAVDVTLPYTQDDQSDTPPVQKPTDAVDIPLPTKGKVPSTTRRQLLDSRRDRRLARFEATIRAGAGHGDTAPRTDAVRRTSNLHAPEHANDTLRFLAEAVITQDHGLFVDYTSL